VSSDIESFTQKEIQKFYTTVSSNVKKIRQEKGLSQMDLALEIGIKSVAFFSNAECNRYGKLSTAELNSAVFS
jgi:putative transcriptional regulator